MLSRNNLPVSQEKAVCPQQQNSAVRLIGLPQTRSNGLSLICGVFVFMFMFNTVRILLCKLGAEFAFTRLRIIIIIIIIVLLPLPFVFDSNKLAWPSCSSSHQSCHKSSLLKRSKENKSFLFSFVLLEV